MQDLFEDGPLKAAQPAFDYKARFAGRAALDAAFALEAMKRNLVRCVAFSSGGFDTHASNYRTQALVQQELFGLVATLVKQLDATPHPTRTGRKLADHTHIVVLSDFCRTPQINLAGGRDHYPNNSALVISPRFAGGLCFGKTDHDQLLPAIAKRFADGERPIAPPDLLATLLRAFQIEPHRYLRDGEVVPRAVTRMKLRSACCVPHPRELRARAWQRRQNGHARSGRGSAHRRPLRRCRRSRQRDPRSWAKARS